MAKCSFVSLGGGGSLGGLGSGPWRVWVAYFTEALLDHGGDVCAGDTRPRGLVGRGGAAHCRRAPAVVQKYFFARVLQDDGGDVCLMDTRRRGCLELGGREGGAAVSRRTPAVVEEIFFTGGC